MQRPEALNRYLLPLMVATATLCALACAEQEPLPSVDAAPAGEACVLSDHELLWKCRLQWYGTEKGLFWNKFLGVPTLQNPLDVWITQEIMFETKPDFIIETGTFNGGSAVLWAMLMGQINPDARIITVDIEDQRTPAAKENPLSRSKVDFLIGSSTDPKVVAEVRKRVGDGRALVILDSLHTGDHVYGELEAYSPMVPVGGYIIVQDTLGPVDAPAVGIERWLTENRNWMVDKSRERLLISNNLGGFLKRLR